MLIEVKKPEDIGPALEGIQKRFDDALIERDEQLKTMGGTVAELKAFIEDQNKKFEDLVRLTREETEGKVVLPFGVEEVKALGWDAVHKWPTKAERIGSSRFADPEKDDLIGQFQKAADDMYMVASVMGFVDNQGRLKSEARSLRFYREKYAPIRQKLFNVIGKDAFYVSSGSGDGQEWDPTEFSTRLFQFVELDLVVAPLFEQFTMPRSPFLFPTDLANVASFKTAEVTGAGSGTAIGDGRGTTSISGSVTFTAEKIATMLWASKEIEEDSIVPILPMMQRKVVRSASRAIDNAIVNGDTAGTHMDADVTSATDVRKCWDGLRDWALNDATYNAKHDASGNKIDSEANWRDYIRGARKKLGDEFKGDNSRLALIVNGNTAIDIGSVESFRTAYAIGALSTNTNPNSTGFKPDGVGAFVVSEFCRSDVDATGVNGASGNTYTTAIQVYRDAWLLGVTRSMRLEVLRERYAELDQDAVKLTWRGDFQPMLQAKHTAITYGIPNA